MATSPKGGATMLDRRRFASLFGTPALASLAAPGVLLRADIHVNNGRIETIRPDLAATGAEIIDASDMIVMPGFVDTHHHMWSSIGRSFTADGGFGYFPAKAATSKLYQPKDFYHSVRL